MTRRPARALFSLAAGSLASAPLLAGGGATGVTERVSYTGDGGTVSMNCSSPVVSGNGRYVAFVSSEALLPEDDNGKSDVYVMDRETGELVCASVNYWGFYGEGYSSAPTISESGRQVAYETSSSHIGFDLNDAVDVIWVDLDEGIPRLASTVNGGVLSGNAGSDSPSISADGRYVALASSASDLVPGDTNGVLDVFVRDMQANTMQRASLGLLGEANGPSTAPSISANGQKVAYHSFATNIVIGDTNGQSDIFVHDVLGGGTQLISRSSSGNLGNENSYWPVLSDDGQVCTFISAASNLSQADLNGESDAFCVVLGQPGVQLVSRGMDGTSASGTTWRADLSPDGRYVAFYSNAGNLTADASANVEIYMKDLETGAVWLMSRPDGAALLSDGGSANPSVSSNGAVVAFYTEATNLDQDDDNGVLDVYVRMAFDDPTSYCNTMLTVDGCMPSIGSIGVPSASADSGFEIVATNVEADKPGLLFYGFSGRRALPFMGGTHCVKGATRRSRILRSVALGAGICDGLFSLDMNAFAAGAVPGNPHPSLSLVGQLVNAQFWGRDPGSPFGVFLSDAIEYVVGP